MYKMDKKTYLNCLQNEIKRAERASIKTGLISPLLALKKEYRRVSQTETKHHTNKD